MSMTAAAGRFVERTPVPDLVTRLGIGHLVARSRRRLATQPADAETAFASDMRGLPIAVNTDAANAQHYELPAEFFRLVLGPLCKYSSCLYENDVSTLSEAENRALDETCAHAGIADGQEILELGCGWGSLSLWMAERYPSTRITAVSNSRSQREYICSAASARGLANIDVITADMNDYVTMAKYDRVVSVEMFEHMSNWRGLLERIAGVAQPRRSACSSMFSLTVARPYRFDMNDKEDWIAQHFFTGGIMPSHGLIRRFPDLFEVEAEWRWSGEHYRRTALHWLANFDRNADAIGRIFRDVYGRDCEMWKRRWRVFFLATAGLFGDAGGQTWGVSHYRLSPAAT